MLNIAPFISRIVERLPEGEFYIYPNYPAYVQSRRTTSTGGAPGWNCARCGRFFHHARAAAHPNCTIERRVPHWEQNQGWIWTTVTEQGPHVLHLRAHVTTELGDPLPRPSPLRGWSRAQDWMDSAHSPLNRGVLPEFRVGMEWWWPYRHYPFYLARRTFRRPKTQGERREAAGWAVHDEIDMPPIRAKRQWKNLVHRYSDIYLQKERSWKQNRIKKQWMVGLDRTSTQEDV